MPKCKFFKATVIVSAFFTVVLGQIDITDEFVDMNFRADVRKATGKNPSDRIYTTDVNGVTMLQIRLKGIQSLAGVEIFGQS
jgi:hypothetical protein